MRNDLTDITMVIDRSGSMYSMRYDAEGGINSFIKKQASEPGEALLTLVQFDTEYTFIHKGVPIKQVPEYKLYPRGLTALLDAVGNAINQTGERLANMAEEDRPGLVVVVIVTDGEENSSKEFTKDDIKRMVEHQQDKYSWKFMFLGANQDAFKEARALGIPEKMSSTYGQNRVCEAYSSTCRVVGEMRSHAFNSSPITAHFTDEDRQAMSGDSTSSTT